MAKWYYSSNTPKSFFTRGGVRTSDSDRADARCGVRVLRERERESERARKGLNLKREVEKGERIRHSTRAQKRESAGEP